jgi:TRAP-type mannitol/chloroaromatic compound transport system permease large subunit
MFDAALSGQLMAAALFAVIVFFLLSGYLVAFTLGGIAILFGFLGVWTGNFDPALFAGLPPRFWGVVTNPVLIAVPLFVFMGVVLERSGIAETLLTTMGQVFGRMRGGLGFSVVLVGALLAAATGVVGATVVTMGLLSLPAMMRAGYDPKLATGTICAAGTLGQILPPSTVLIFMADILQGANSAAQFELGNFAPDTVSVGDLFAGAFIPSLILAALYMLLIAWKAVFRPDSCPAVPMTAAERAGLARRVVSALIPPLTLIVAVLGSIVSGVATPTESASVGSLGALFLAAVKLLADHHLGEAGDPRRDDRLFWFWLAFLGVLAAVGAAWGGAGLLNFMIGALALALVAVLAGGRLRAAYVDTVFRSCVSTMSITSMVFVILLGATAFALVFTQLGGDTLVRNFLEDMPGGQFGALLTVFAIVFVLGFFLDTFEILFIVIPITAPVLLLMGVDAIWLGVMLGMLLQTSFLTPPFGFSLFYLRGVAPAAITTMQIYRGVVPFIGLQLAALAVIWIWPEVATWLPDALFRSAAVGADGAPAAPPPAFDEGLGADDEFL